MTPVSRKNKRGTIMYYNEIPDHPIIRNCEQTGYPNGKPPRYPICTVCQDECDTLYRDDYNRIVGCDCCINRKNVEDKNVSCPVCGTELVETHYVNQLGQIVGCEHCVHQSDAWEESDADQ